MRPKTPWIVCALCVLVTSSCENPVGPIERCLSQAEFDGPFDITMFKGDTLQFSVVVRDCNNTVLPNHPVQWMSSDISIVAVDNTGLAIARAQGYAYLEWSAIDLTGAGAFGVTNIRVSEYAARVEIGPTDLRVVPEGPGFLTATAFAENGDALFPGWTATWESGDDGIATVNAAGVVRGVAEGVTSITATVHDASATVEVTVTLLTLVDVHVGHSFTCGATTDGFVFCWGRNESGALGDPNSPSDHRLRMVVGRTRVRSVTAGGTHACALDEDGTVWCWGSAASGQLGASLFGGVHRPSRVASEIPFRDVSAGDAHTCGITPADTPYCWGSNADGRLGAESASVCSFGKGGGPPCSLIPIAVSGLNELQVISAGGAHTCGLDLQGAAICWGANYAGQLGLGAVSDSVGSPTNVDTQLRFERISSGGSHSCAVTGAGEIYCWGYNPTGQLGNGTLGNRTLPVAVASTERFTIVDAGFRHTCALTEAGVAYCWGGNRDGQLGDGSGDQSPKLVPTLVAVVPALQSISAGATHSCGLGVDGVAYCWGNNLDGQLGAEAGDPS
ncbi:MAG: Ig-like domain-containing protein, partial [Gemmatimonadales bacterium]